MILDQVELNSAFYAAKEGNGDAFTLIFDAYWDMAYYRCLKRLRNEQDAEDAVQEVFLMLNRRIVNMKGPEYLPRGIQYYTLEVCNEYYRKNKMAPSEMLVSLENVDEYLPEPKEEFLPEVVLERKEMKAMILDLINDLPNKQREVLFNYYFNDFSAKEISTLLNISVSSVNFHLYKARKKLVTLIGKQTGEGMARASATAVVPILTRLYTEEMASVALPQIRQRVLSGLRYKLELEASLAGQAGQASQTGQASQAGQAQGAQTQSQGAQTQSQGPKRFNTADSYKSMIIKGAASIALFAGISIIVFNHFHAKGAPPPKPVINQEYLAGVKIEYYLDTMDEDGYMGSGYDETVKNLAVGSMYTLSGSTRDKRLPEGYCFADADFERLYVAPGLNIIKVLYTKPDEAGVIVRYYRDTMDEAGYMGAAYDERVDGLIPGAGYTLADALRSKRAPAGYVFAEERPQYLDVTPDENVINVLYKKLNNLSVTVKYFRDRVDESGYMGADHDETVGGLTFGAPYSLTGALRDKHLPKGYRFADASPERLDVAAGGNIINVLYEKADSLSVRVRYYLDTADAAGYMGPAFDTAISGLESGSTYALTRAAREKHLPEGYRFAYASPERVVVGSDGGVINALYKKLDDLSVKIKYYKDTPDDAGYMGSALDATVDGLVFGDPYKIPDAIRDKNKPIGYDRGVASPDHLNVAVKDNVIRVLYKKLSGLSVTVQYYKDTLDDAGYMGAGYDKTVSGLTFGDPYALAGDLRDASLPEGYRFDNAGAERVVVSADDNVIKVLYKKIDISSASVTRHIGRLKDSSAGNLEFTVAVELTDGVSYVVDHVETVNGLSRGNGFFTYETAYGAYAVYAAWNAGGLVTSCEVRAPYYD